MDKKLKRTISFLCLAMTALATSCGLNDINSDDNAEKVDVNELSDKEGNEEKSHVDDEKAMGDASNDNGNDVSSIGVDDGANDNSNINNDLSYGVVHSLGTSYVTGMIRNKYAQISTISGDDLESSKVNLRYIFELDTTDRDLSLYTIKIELNLKHSRSDEIIRTIKSDITSVYHGYYSDGNLITKDNTCYVVYTLTNIPYNSWDYDFDVNCLIMSDEEEESADASNNVLSVLVEENNEIIDTGFSFLEANNDECVLTEYSGSGKKVVIPDRKITTEYDEYTGRNYSYYKAVTAIGDNLLKDNDVVETVIIPDGIKTIGANAFSGCTSLTMVQMSNAVTSIGANAFNGCDSLNELVLSKNITSIGANAFSAMPSILYYGGKSNEIRNLIASTFDDENIVWYFKTFNEQTVDSSGNHWYRPWFSSEEIIAKTYHKVTLNISDDEKLYEYVENNDSLTLDENLELDERYFIGWYQNGCVYDDKQKITSDITIDAKWVYASEISFGYAYGYELYDLDTLDLETIDLSNRGFRRPIISIVDKNKSQEPNNVTTTIVLPDSLLKCSDLAFADFYNIKNVYYDGDESRWCDIKFEGVYGNPASCQSFENFYVLKDDKYTRVTTLELDCVRKIGDYQFFNITQIEGIVLSRDIELIGHCAFGYFTMYNVDDDCIDNVYYANPLGKNNICFFDDNEDYNEYPSRLRNDSKWYQYCLPDDMGKTGDYWYKENNTIICNTYCEIKVHNNDGIADQIESYIRPINSSFDIELSKDDMALDGFYRDKEYNDKFDAEIITEELELYAKWVPVLNYTLSSSGNYYIVSLGDVHTSEVIIPETYNNKPVSEVAAYAFMNDTTIQSIQLSDNIIKIGLDAFKGCTNLSEVKWNSTLDKWCNIDFANEYSNPMIYAEYYLVKRTSSMIDYELLEELFISGGTVCDISNYSLTGFSNDRLIICSDSYWINEYTFYNTAIEEIYIYGDYKNSKYDYKNLIEKLTNTNIKVYRYISDFRIIDEIYEGSNDWNSGDYSGYWFNISGNYSNYDFYMPIEVEFNKARYFMVVIDEMTQYVREGERIRNLIPDYMIVLGYYEDDIEFDASTPIYRNYVLRTELDSNPYYSDPEMCIVTLAYYNDIDSGIFVSEKTVNIYSGSYLKISDISDDEYELEDIYLDSNYNDTYDLNTPITGNIKLYPKYNKKMNCRLIYDSFNGGYKYVLYIDNISGYNVVIPSSYNGVPIVSLSCKMFNNGFTVNTLTIPEGIIEIDENSFAGCHIQNLVLPKSLKYIHQGAFNNASIDYLLYDGYLLDWLLIDFENEDANPISASGNLYVKTNSFNSFNSGEFYQDHMPVKVIDSIRFNEFGYYGMWDEYRQSNGGTLKFKKYQFANMEMLEEVKLDRYDCQITIEEGAFRNCTNLNSFIFGIDNGETIINKGAFVDSRIDVLKLGGILSIEKDTFRNCDINKLVITINNPYYFAIKKNAFANSHIQKVYYRFGSITEFGGIGTISIDDELMCEKCYKYSESSELPGNYWYYDNDEIIEYTCTKLTVKFNYGINDLELVYNKDQYNNQFDKYNLLETIERYLELNYESLYLIDDLFNNSLYNEYYGNFDIHIDNPVVYAKLVPSFMYQYINGGIYITGLGKWSEKLQNYIFGNIVDCLVLPDTYHNEPVLGISERVFECCHINNLIMPDTIIEICEHAFDSSQIMNIRFSKKLEIIGDYAFYRSGTGYYNLPSSLQSIGKYAFSETNINEITIPNSVVSIGEGAFKNCLNLNKVQNKSQITEISEALFAIDDGMYSWRYFEIDVEIPESVRYIADDAFKNQNVRLITYSNNIEFSNDAFSNVHGDYMNYNVYVYPNTFTSNLDILNSRFKIFMYTSDYEEKRFGYWWHFNNEVFSNRINIVEIINM